MRLLLVSCRHSFVESSWFSFFDTLFRKSFFICFVEFLSILGNSSVPFQSQFSVPVGTFCLSGRAHQRLLQLVEQAVKILLLLLSFFFMARRILQRQTEEVKPSTELDFFFIIAGARHDK